MKEETQAEILFKVHDRIKNYLEKNFDLSLMKADGRVRIIQRENDSMLLDYQSLNGRNIYRYIRVKDTSTGNYYFLSVPNELKNCREALAWGFRIPPSEYNLVKET
jgi:hypothetical protein